MKDSLDVYFGKPYWQLKRIADFYRQCKFLARIAACHIQYSDCPVAIFNSVNIIRKAAEISELNRNKQDFQRRTVGQFIKMSSQSDSQSGQKSY